jgi:hypothetical protein
VQRMGRQVIALDSLPWQIRTSIETGETAKQVCPRCDGGSSNERSLYIRYGDDDVVTLKCYRVSCGWFALLLADGSAEVTRKKVRQGRLYREPTRPVDGKAAATLGIEYGLAVDSFENRWRLSDDREWLVMSIRDPYGRERGHHGTAVSRLVVRQYQFPSCRSRGRRAIRVSLVPVGLQFRSPSGHRHV